MDELSANNWKAIWQAKGIVSSPLDDASLLSLSGYDTGFGNVAAAGFACYVAEVCDALGVRDGASLLDIGCGPGLFARNIPMTLGFYCGIDYSGTLLAVARRLHPTGLFLHTEAASIDIIRCRFDSIISNSVFQYFPSHSYAMKVLSKSFNLLKSGGSMAVLDLNDADRVHIYHSTRRLYFADSKDYQAEYAGLAHMFYSRKKLREDCKKLGFEVIRMEDQHMPGYANNAYRFNVYLRK